MKRSALLTAALAVSILGALAALNHKPQQASAKVAETPVPSAAPAAVGGEANAPAALPAAYPDDGFRLARPASLPSSAPGGRSGTRPPPANDRFHTYTFQQRVGVLIDWGGCCGRGPARPPLPLPGA